MEQNVLAPWELRIGDFRIFYDVDDLSQTVVFLAVGTKVHNVLYVGGQELQL